MQTLSTSIRKNKTLATKNTLPMRPPNITLRFHRMCTLPGRMDPEIGALLNADNYNRLDRGT